MKGYEQMIIKVICVGLAILCAVIALGAKKFLPLLLNREVTEREIVLAKAVLLLVCIAIAMTMILPDYM